MIGKVFAVFAKMIGKVSAMFDKLNGTLCFLWDTEYLGRILEMIGKVFTKFARMIGKVFAMVGSWKYFIGKFNSDTQLYPSIYLKEL